MYLLQKQRPEMMTREQAVAVARSFCGTPYVLGGHLKGAGVDCATLLAEYLIEIGASEREPLSVYSHDWFHHASEERYKYALLKHARQVVETICRGTPETRPGDLVLFKVARSRIYNHGAIVTGWPYGVHAFDPKVSEVNLLRHALTVHTEMAIFTPWSD
jgi:cell wall-associated NlpC family hydrolase